ncbi:MAG: ATPase [Methanobrevibacter millerae]|uniref:ATPase n=1 Tax=Methanobrevibacter millerae TaxID=230361 RepID=A0A8T3VD44_9EURY|nr:ATPase [Methanobrevibacter millerae]MBE6505878.1 ATPase [Methanobrevibacter millerae]
MNQTLLLVWAAIAIIGIISIIIVKIYFKDKESEETNFKDITTKNPLQEMISENNEKKERTNTISNYFSKEEEQPISLRKEGTEADKEFNPYIVPENNIPNRNISYSSQNQVLINYDDRVQKFQEPITETQRDIMSPNKNEENPDVTYKKTSESKTELKDLFTIDELIKESKRKDDERDKESKTIKKEAEDNSDIKESIKKNQEAKEVTEENSDVKDIRDSIEKMHEIAEAIKSSGNDNSAPQSTASQKDITEAINTATTENEKEEIPEISETASITDAVIKKESEPKEETTVQETLPVEEKPVTEEKAEKISEAIPESEEIKTPSLKTPTKIEEDSVSILSGADEDYEFGASIDSSNLFEDENGELSDLDYRKDLAKFTNTIKNSSIVKDIREKLIPEQEEQDSVNEDFIRNVNSYTEEAYEYYDEYEPIINETHVDYVEPTPEEELRQENTRRVFENAKTSAVEEKPLFSEEKIPTPKEIPEKSSLKVSINNNDEVLRKGDEIIFTHEGETYSSKVYSINGDDIKVKYRRQDITIKPKDIKKIY